MLRPYPAPRQWQGSHLTLLRGRGKVPLSLCAYKYREEGKKRRKRKETKGGKILEKERRAVTKREETEPNREGKQTGGREEDF
jgi:hypothetical protein